MPREKQIQPAIVHGYQVPGEVRPKITGAESVVWYIEPDAQEQANSLAGHAVKLPYFFCGNPPEEGKRWPKHRRGGLAFVRNWLAAHAGDQLDRDATAVTAKKPGLKAAAERAADEAKPDTAVNEAKPTDSDEVDALRRAVGEAQEATLAATVKLKAERATSRGLRKDLKAAEERSATADAVANDLARRVTNQQTLLNDMDTTHREQRLALRRILDRAQVAYGVVNRLPLATDLAHRRRDHALAELRSIRELAKEMLPGTPEAQRDDGVDSKWVPAQPADFPQQNGVLGAPPGYEDSVESLPVHRTEDGRIISCWHLSEDERAEVARTGKVWLHVWGRTHAPVYVGGESPFVERAE